MKQTIIIMVDTQRQDMLSCYNKNSLKTTFLDSLSENGTLFTNAFTCQPVCGPARSAIFTGLYPHSNGMYSNCMQLGEKVKNIALWLNPYNIECGYIGKWHLDGGDYFGYGKCARGFNSKYWYDMRNYLEEFTDKERQLSRKNMNGRYDDPKAENTYAYRCVNRAISFIEEFKNNDFCLTLSLDEPHDPSVCPRKYFKLLKTSNFKIKKTPNTKASLRNKPEHQKIWAKRFKNVSFGILKQSQKALYACNLFCDDEIGRLLKKIKELEIDPMIVYTSDHGDMLLSHKLLGKGAVMYNEITKVPFIISGGGFTKEVNTTPISHIDILPTIIKFFGLSIPGMLQGEPIQQLCNNTARNIFIEFTRYEVDHDGFMGFQPIRCICNGNFKLIINLLSEDELYDLTLDTYEKVNLIYNKKYFKIRNNLHNELIEKMNTTRDVFRGYYWHCRPWRKVKPSFDHTGYTRQLVEEDFVQLDYGTGMPMSGGTRKK